MNRLAIIAAFFALVFLAGRSALAQSGYDLFQKGLIQERTEGDLEEAIKLYKQIVDEHKDDRALMAKALVQMGGCYEKLGRAEARKAYERVVQEFADQTEPVRVARRQLEQLDGGATGTAGNGPAYRLVMDEKITRMPIRRSHFSPSGDRVVILSQNKLYITNQTCTVIRPLIEDLGQWKNIAWPRWSPDGRLISYRLQKAPLMNSDEEEIISANFVINPDDGTSRQIGKEVRGRSQGPFWTPDSRHLSYRTKDGLHTLSLDGDEVRLIPEKDLQGVYRWDLGYSPNGRWIVSSRKDGLCIFPTMGGTVRHLINLPGGNHYPTWAPDGRTLYFVSSSNIWKLSMDQETGLAKSQPQQLSFFKDVLISWAMISGDGSRIYFNMSRGTSHIKVAEASSPHEAHSLVRSARCSPVLSPDGQTVYYVADGIYAVSREGGAPRRLTESLPAKGYPPSWLDLSPDGQILAYVARLGDGGNIYTLPVSGGDPKILVKITSADFGVGVRWSPDGSHLAYGANKGLFVVDAAGGEPREIAHLERGWENNTLRWSPDGKFIAAFCSDMDKTPTPGPQNAIFVVPASGGEPRQLTPDIEYKQRLEWHPDGKRITYHVSRFNSETRQAYLDGRPPSLLVDAPDVWDYEGAWAPDGRRFFFTATTDNGSSLFVYDEVSGKITLVDPTVESAAGVPSWSRDGKTMAWCATSQTNQTWVMENFLPASPATQLPNPPTGNYFVTQSGDDAEEWGGGNMYLDSSDLELVHDDSNSRGDQVVGIRLADIRIPKGSHIKKAYVQFTTDEVSTKLTDLTIRAELTGNAKTFTTSKSDISARKRTKASVKWSPAPWKVAYERIEKQQTPDLSSLIQEVVDQPDWQEGNAIALIFTGSGQRLAVSFDDGGRHYGPMLHIEY